MFPPLVEEEELKTEDYVIAGIDILGTKKNVYKEKDNEYLNLVNKIYRATIRYCNYNNSDLFKNSISHPIVNYNIFSDNIVFYAKIINDIYPPVVNTIIGFTAVFQALAISEKLLTRGAIAKGKLYCDNNFIYGKALIEVAEAEAKLAIYPRVILTDSVTQDYKFSSLITTDFDNLQFVNYYSLIDTKNNRIIADDVDRMKKIILYLKEKYDNDTKIMQKIGWLINYHNSYVTKLIGTWGISEDHLIMPVVNINEKIEVINNSGYEKYCDKKSR